MLSQDIRKLFSFSQIFINVPWWWSAPSCAGSHHFTQFGSWSGVAKVVHLKVIEQPRRILFVSSFPPRQRQRRRRPQRPHAHTTHEQRHGTAHHTNKGTTWHTATPMVRQRWQHSMIAAPIESATFDSGRSAGCGEEGLGLGLRSGRIHLYIYMGSGPMSGPMSGPRLAHDWPTTYFHRK